MQNVTNRNILQSCATKPAPGSYFIPGQKMRRDDINFLLKSLLLNHNLQHIHLENMEGPVSIYLRLIDYNSLALTTYGTYVGDIASIKDTFDAENPQFIRISTYSTDIDQTLNIGSLSTGAGAG
jgi:hypothetical protein